MLDSGLGNFERVVVPDQVLERAALADLGPAVACSGREVARGPVLDPMPKLGRT